MSAVLDLLEDDHVTRLCAPMVRCSKLPFRKLVRIYDCDITYTPMIMADSFVQSHHARTADFSTDGDDAPLMVQFAASSDIYLAKAAELTHRFADGIDLNCGCPQKWAMKEGIGASLIYQPQLVHCMVRSVRRQLPSTCLSIKIRLNEKGFSESVHLMKAAEAAGVDFITVHGRSPWQRTEPVDLDSIAELKAHSRVPVVANGDIRCVDDMVHVQQKTKVNGVMCARGLLENPALFSGALVTPKSAIQNWVSICMEQGVTFTFFHHILVLMLDKQLVRPEKRIFNTLPSTSAVLDYLHNNLSI